MEKIKNLSLKKTFILYMVISLFCSFFLSAFIINIAGKTQRNIWTKYIDMEKYYKIEQEGNRNIQISVPRADSMEMNKLDGYVTEICDFLQTYTVLLLSIAGSCIAIGLFYRDKLKIPIEQLGQASEMIAQDELDFIITYKNKDELGQLCKDFEKMRMQLVENNRNLWHMVEEEKALRAAIAHDIRSPLTILKGYQEMLLEFIPEEILDKEKVIEMLQEGMKQIERMNRFIETMRKMTSLSDREIQLETINVNELGAIMKAEADILGKQTSKECTVIVNTLHQCIDIDTEVVLEVTENLLSNAFRFARKKIEIFLFCTSNELEVVVMDDGAGFKDNPELVTKAFYHSNPQDELQHFGLGMYISRIYCEKHGGRLLIENQNNKGAIVKAIFQLKL